VNTYIDYTNLFRDVLIDIISLYFFAYRVLYRRYHNKQLFIICSAFNVFLLLVIMALVRTTFSVAVGFGLFALLSMLTLRSSPFNRGDMAFMFGGIALAVINGAGIPDLIFVGTANITIIVTAFVLSSRSIDNTATMAVTLDRVDPDALTNQPAMTEKLRLMFNMDVSHFTIRRVDYVRDLMELTIAYVVPPIGEAAAGQPHRLAPVGDESGQGTLLLEPTGDTQ
jgi:hypothetical protein